MAAGQLQPLRAGPGGPWALQRRFRPACNSVLLRKGNGKKGLVPGLGAFDHLRSEGSAVASGFSGQTKAAGHCGRGRLCRNKAPRRPVRPRSLWGVTLPFDLSQDHCCPARADTAHPRAGRSRSRTDERWLSSEKTRTVLPGPFRLAGLTGLAAGPHSPWSLTPHSAEPADPRLGWPGRVEMVKSAQPRPAPPRLLCPVDLCRLNQVLSYPVHAEGTPQTLRQATASPPLGRARGQGRTPSPTDSGSASSRRGDLWPPRV